jgi:hypothetical protein
MIGHLKSSFSTLSQVLFRAEQNSSMKSNMPLNLSNGHANYMAIDMPPTKPHRERHTAGSEYLESAVLGMADGLTVPFALTAGLSS